MCTEPTAMISVEVRRQVAVVQMRRGKANALDTALCRSLTAEFGELAGRGCRAAVLTGRGSIFSAGVDLLRLRDGGPGYLDEFLPALSQAFLAVFDCPVPVVAAVNGHAIAGRCVLICACDYRVMNDGHGRIGVTELLVGVLFPITALEILRFAVGTRINCRVHRPQALEILGPDSLGDPGEFEPWAPPQPFDDNTYAFPTAGSLSPSFSGTSTGAAAASVRPLTASTRRWPPGRSLAPIDTTGCCSR